ncbi:ead/Ea22-like family protein [Escherichia coli]|uniref:ead/Ea22-like family protein n=1 Tax=Escherichia coli TaxID=562 RepID=UPI003C6D4D01
MDVTIVVHSPGSIGSTPSVEVQSIHAGFDWDSGKVLIFPAQPLTTLTPEQVADITDSVRKGQSWHAYQEYKKHKEQLEKLSIELDAAKQRVGKLRVELEAAKSKLNEQREYYEGVIADGSKRIAELEEREILLPERSSMLHRTDFHDDYQTVMAYKVSEVIAAIRAAGIRIKGGE